MIGEWGSAIGNKLRTCKIMFLWHSFLIMSFLAKRVSETWMVSHMQSPTPEAIIGGVF